MRARRQCKESSELPCKLSCRSPTPLAALVRHRRRASGRRVRCGTLWCGTPQCARSPLQCAFFVVPFSEVV